VLPGDLEVVLARFGNVTNDVAKSLRAALEQESAELPGCAVALVGPRIDGDLVVADLRGEVDRVAATAGALARLAEVRGIYVDRRVFRHGVVLARLDADQRGSAIEQRLGRLTHWYSSPWLADEVTLVRTGWRGENPIAEPWCAIELRGDSGDSGDDAEGAEGAEAQSARIAATSAEA
jgi:hypothetical protein